MNSPYTERITGLPAPGMVLSLSTWESSPACLRWHSYSPVRRWTVEVIRQFLGPLVGGAMFACAQTLTIPYTSRVMAWRILRRASLDAEVKVLTRIRHLILRRCRDLTGLLVVPRLPSVYSSAQDLSLGA